MLVGLRAGALGRVDDEEEEVDPRRAGDHGPHEPLVPGDVDERQHAAVRELERRVAEVDRDPARPLLGQPVGVLAGERADERRLAVVDVTGGADRQRPRVRTRRWRSPGVARQRRRGRPRRPRRRPASARRAAGGRRGRRRRPAAPRAGARPRASPRSRTRRSGARRAAARRRRRARPSPRPRRRRAPRAARLARAPPRAARRASAARGSRGALAPGRAIRAERPLERGERQLVGAERALERMTAQPLDELARGRRRCRPAARRAACRPRSRRGRRPAARLAAAVGSSPRSSSEPEPRSSTSGSPARFAIPASSCVETAAVKPTIR